MQIDSMNQIHGSFHHGHIYQFTRLMYEYAPRLGDQNAEMSNISHSIIAIWPISMILPKNVGFTHFGVA